MSPRHGAAVIATDGLTKRYGRQRGLEDVTLSVRRGEVFGLLGPNGAGKTTMIRTLLDLLHPSSGAALVFGLDSHRDSRRIHARLGNLPGDFAFDNSLTGRELLRLFAGLRGLRGLGRAEQLAQRFRADLERPIGHLSRGSRQKVGLIQALFHEPELLILDEPTTGLDPLMQEEFVAMMEEERGCGRTVFLSSHDLTEVERVCDRVGIIRAGRLVAVEEVTELTDKTYRHVSLELVQPVDPAEFGRLPGVSEVVADGRRIHFRVSGGIDPVIKAAAGYEVVDMELAHPSLEEIFVTYFAEDA